MRLRDRDEKMSLPVTEHVCAVLTWGKMTRRWGTSTDVAKMYSAFKRIMCRYAEGSDGKPPSSGTYVEGAREIIQLAEFETLPSVSVPSTKFFFFILCNTVSRVKRHD